MATVDLDALEAELFASIGKDKTFDAMPIIRRAVSPSAPEGFRIPDDTPNSVLSAVCRCGHQYTCHLHDRVLGECEVTTCGCETFAPEGLRDRIADAYARYDSDSRVNGVDDFEAFIDAVRSILPDRQSIKAAIDGCVTPVSLWSSEDDETVYYSDINVDAAVDAVLAVLPPAPRYEMTDEMWSAFSSAKESYSHGNNAETDVCDALDRMTAMLEGTA